MCKYRNLFYRNIVAVVSNDMVGQCLGVECGAMQQGAADWPGTVSALLAGLDNQLRIRGPN